MTTVIHGNGFDPASTVRLTGLGPDIPAGAVQVSAERNVLYATFDLVGRPRGLRDVVATNPAGPSVTLRNAFTIEAGLQPQLSVDIVGRPAVRVGRPQEYTIVFTNRGNVDAVAVPLWVAGIPKDATWSITSETSGPIDTTGEFAVQFEMGNDLVLPLFVPLMSAGTSGSISLSISVPSTRTFQLRSWTGRPLVNGPSRACMEEPWQKCALGSSKLIAQFLAPELVPFLGCAENIVKSLCTGNRLGQGTATPGQLWSLPDAFTKAILDCAGVSPEQWKATVYRAVRKAIAQFFTLVDCAEALRDGIGSLFNIFAGASFDPNDKVGTIGAGTERFVASKPLTYSIFFENLSTATLPAQQVIIIDRLDPEKFDLATFSLGWITFGRKRVTPPPGLNNYSTVVDLRPTNNLLVRIDAGLNSSTGDLRWHFTSLDPATNLPTSDPIAGFLPPNRIPPEGDGSVLFTVMPKPGLPTGTQIRNRAAITFDTNAAIITPEWLNTIDADAPASQVLPLSPTQTSSEFTVKWQGVDSGSGIRTYTVYVSDNGGPFTTWLSDMASTEAKFTGMTGHTYRFYSIAVDHAGNSEPAKTATEATTTVTATACAADVTAQFTVVRGGFRLNNTTKRFVQAVTLTKNAGNALAGPFALVIDRLSPSATLYSPAGVTSCSSPSGSPYVNLTPGALWVAGQSVSPILEFTNPTNAGITYAVRILAGGPNR